MFPRHQRALFRTSLTSLFLLAACDEAGESPTAPLTPTEQPNDGYDISSLPPTLFARGLRPGRSIRASPGAAAIGAPKEPGGKPSPLANGSFELNGGPGSNQLTDWTVVDNSPWYGSWWAQAGGASPLNSFLVGPPTDGVFATMTDQTGPGLHILYQDVQVPHGPAILSFDLYLNNLAGVFFTPNTLSP
jgi:hypothetical protein